MKSEVVEPSGFRFTLHFFDRMTEPTREKAEETEVGKSEAPAVSEPRWRPPGEPTCCGAGCDDCPF